MNEAMNDDTRLVYSTQSGKICPRCGKGKSVCQCRGRAKSKAEKASPFKNDGIVRIQKEVKGRKGKCASVIYGLDVESERLGQIAREVKNHCATGGTVKDGVFVIQGDHRVKIRMILEKHGFRVKLAGG